MDPRPGQLLFITVPAAGAQTRVRLPRSRYFQFWNGGSSGARLTPEYGGRSLNLPTVAAFTTSPLYLNPFDGDGFVAFTDPTAGPGTFGWLIISGD